jgi:alcohol dehydrogenase class IV
VDLPQRDPSTAAAGFKQARANLADVGFAFGGGCFLDMAFV